MGESSLTIIGSGIQYLRDITYGAKIHIQKADIILYLVNNPLFESWIKDENPNAESLHSLYIDQEPRKKIYQNIIDKIFFYLNQDLRVCVVFYGHPGFFVYASHKAIKLARENGIVARMLPGISTIDCLIADIGYDPGIYGMQCYEATDFIVRNRKVDINSALILLQVGLIGYTSHQSNGYKLNNILILKKRLEEIYPKNHNLIIYEAPIYPAIDPIIKTIYISDLPINKLSEIATIFIPPMNHPPFKEEYRDFIEKKAFK